MSNIELEDPHIIPDLRTLNSSASSAKISRSWSECEAVLNEKVGVAVDNHHHTEVTIWQVLSPLEICGSVLNKDCPLTPIPSQEWLHVCTYSFG